MLGCSCQGKPPRIARAHRAAVRPEQLAQSASPTMVLPSRSASAVLGRALRGAAASGRHLGVSLVGVSPPCASVEYVACSWKGKGAACFSSFAAIPEIDTLLLAMASPSVYEPGGLHASLRNLGLDEAVEYLPPELPRVCAASGGTCISRAAASLVTLHFCV